MGKMTNKISQEINRVIPLSMGGNREAIEALEKFLKDPNPEIRTRATDRLNRARRTEETAIVNGLNQMGNISGLEGEILLIRKVAERTAHTLDEKTAVNAFLDARNGTLEDWKERRKRHEENVAHAKDEDPQRMISYNAYAFRGPTIKAKMQRALEQCGVNTIENKLLPAAINNNFHFHMDETTRAEVVQWLTGELQKRKKPETVMSKLKKRIGRS